MGPEYLHIKKHAFLNAWSNRSVSKVVVVCLSTALSHVRLNAYIGLINMCVRVCWLLWVVWSAVDHLFPKGFRWTSLKDLWRVVPFSWWDSQACWMAHLRISHAPCQWRFPLLSWGLHVFLWGVPRFIKGFPEGLHWMTWGFPWTYPRASWRISLISLSIYMDIPRSPLKPLQISSRTLPEGLHLFSLRTYTRGS